jgi:peptide/nickel transport system permease protein
MFESVSHSLRVPKINARKRIVIFTFIAAVYLVGVFIWGTLMPDSAYAVRYADKFLAPSLDHPFGTDFMGRDMFFRSVKGLSNSLVIGLIASLISSVIGLFFGVSSAVIGGKYDKFILLAVDCCMGLPHLVLLILISVLLGRGARGVLLGVAFTHWPELTRLVRADVLQMRSAQYVQAAYKMGKNKWQVAVHHILPHVMPVYVVGLVLLFPHAIMHESSITFLGFGLSAETPAIGVILAEAMKHIATGKWWLALFPGLLLILTVLLFYAIGENLKKLLNPASAQE